MKETHLFYAPEVRKLLQLPEEEAAHAVRVLRLQTGDGLWVTDGHGFFYDCVITGASGGRQPQCFVRIDKVRQWKKTWQGHIEVAMAPTKNQDRIEWTAEKATEIGMDAMNLIDCAFSERHHVKTERLERIVTNAMKQSHKAIKPIVRTMTSFRDFIAAPFDGERFIAHCYHQQDVNENTTKAFLYDMITPGTASLVLIGPEGDFSIEEVRAAENAGFRSVHLGESRLRTETAALVAVQLMNLKKTI